MDTLNEVFKLFVHVESENSLFLLLEIIECNALRS